MPEELVTYGYINDVEKVWGKEFWIVNNELYCAKILELAPGGMSSLHYHDKKDETFKVLEGSCFLVLGEHTPVNQKFLQKGDMIRIKPKTLHRFYCTRISPFGCKILEISTPHSDEDVVRLEPSKKL